MKSWMIWLIVAVIIAVLALWFVKAAMGKALIGLAFLVGGVVGWFLKAAVSRFRSPKENA